MKQPISIGAKLDFLPVSMQTMLGDKISLPFPCGVTHVMFRRFAGCPICNVALRQYMLDIDQLKRVGVTSIVVFHSSLEDVLRFQNGLQGVHVVSDPKRDWYRIFGVGTSLWSVANPRVWPIAIGEIIRSGLHFPSEAQNPFVLPADFLISADANLLDMSYATDASLVWSSSDVLAKVRGIVLVQR